MIYQPDEIIFGFLTSSALTPYTSITQLVCLQVVLYVFFNVNLYLRQVSYVEFTREKDRRVPHRSSTRSDSAETSGQGLLCGTQYENR